MWTREWDFEGFKCSAKLKKTSLIVKVFTSKTGVTRLQLDEVSHQDLQLLSDSLAHRVVRSWEKKHKWQSMLLSIRRRIIERTKKQSRSFVLRLEEK